MRTTLCAPEAATDEACPSPNEALMRDLDRVLADHLGVLDAWMGALWRVRDGTEYERAVPPPRRPIVECAAAANTGKHDSSR